MNADVSNGHAERTVKVRDALSMLDSIDKHCNLHVSASILVFFSSFGFGILSFFVIYNLIIFDGITEFVALMLISISFVLIIPIWVLSFLFTMTMLDTMGIKDLRSITRHRLSGLTLSFDELRELREHLMDREWKHGRIFENVITDLANGRMRAGSDKPVSD
jgi:hypothetical protein